MNTGDLFKRFPTEVKNDTFFLQLFSYIILYDLYIKLVFQNIQERLKLTNLVTRFKRTLPCYIVVNFTQNVLHWSYTSYKIDNSFQFHLNILSQS